jgi:hypothetical protein
MKLRVISIVSVAGAFFLGVSAAQAFTLEDQSGSGGQGFLDLEKPAAPPDRLSPSSRFNTENGQTTFKMGNSTFRFGQQQSFSERFNANNLFDPFAREGR